MGWKPEKEFTKGLMKQLEDEGFADAARCDADGEVIYNSILALAPQIRVKPPDKMLERMQTEIEKLSLKAKSLEDSINVLHHKNENATNEIQFNNDKLLNQVIELEEFPSKSKIALVGSCLLAIGILLHIYSTSISYKAFFSSVTADIQKLEAGGLKLSDLSIESVLMKDVLTVSSENPLVFCYVNLFSIVLFAGAYLLYQFKLKRSKKNIWLISGILIFADIILALKISKDHYVLKRMTGLVEDIPFSYLDLLLSESFSLILVSGAVCFFIFKKLLELLMNELAKFNPKRRIQQQNTLLKKQIAKRDKQIMKLDADRKKILAKALEAQIKMNGAIPSFEALREYLSAYMIGVRRYVANTNVDVVNRQGKLKDVFNRTLKTISKTY